MWRGWILAVALVSVAATSCGSGADDEVTVSSTRPEPSTTEITGANAAACGLFETEASDARITISVSERTGKASQMNTYGVSSGYANAATAALERADDPELVRLLVAVHSAMNPIGSELSGPFLDDSLTDEEKLDAFWETYHKVVAAVETEAVAVAEWCEGNGVPIEVGVIP